MDPAKINDIGAIIAHWGAKREAKEAQKAANRRAGAKKAAETRRLKKGARERYEARQQFKNDLLGLAPTPLDPPLGVVS